MHGESIAKDSLAVGQFHLLHRLRRYRAMRAEDGVVAQLSEPELS